MCALEIEEPPQSRPRIVSDPLRSDPLRKSKAAHRHTVASRSPHGSFGFSGDAGRSHFTHFSQISDDNADTLNSSRHGLDPRSTMSWAAGSARREVLQPLRPLGGTAASFALGEDLNTSRTFGGIDRRIRPTLPTKRQVVALRSFMQVLKESTDAEQRPRIVAFVNSKSGGQAGELLRQTLREHLGSLEDEKAIEGEVCDLSLDGEPENTIQFLAESLKFSEAPTRLLVCGGDGTVTWILTALEQCEDLQGKLHLLPVAIVPLGTGNDLARSLGWGPKLERVGDILQYLKWAMEGVPCIMDQWRLVIRPHTKLPEDHKLRTHGSHPQLVQDKELAVQLLGDMHEALESDEGTAGEVFVGYWQNYFSVGADAMVVSSVEHSRNETACGRRCFRSGLGKICYVWQMLAGLRNVRNVSDTIGQLKVGLPDSTTDALVDMHSELRQRRMVVLGMVNINSYGSGSQVQPNLIHTGDQPSPSDGLMEVFSFRNVLALGAANISIRPKYHTSAGAVVFRLKSAEHMQIDGEGWRLDSGCDVLIEPHRKVTMLCAPQKARHWRGHVSQKFWLQGGADQSQPLLQKGASVKESTRQPFQCVVQ